PHDLPIQPDRPQERGVSDVVVGDVVDFEAAGGGAAQQHVGGVGVEEAAEAGKTPIGANLSHEIPCQDRVVTDVVDFIEAVRAVAQDHVGGGGGRWRRIVPHDGHQIPTEDVHVDEVERRHLV